MEQWSTKITFCDSRLRLTVSFKVEITTNDQLSDDRHHRNDKNMKHTFPLGEQVTLFQTELFATLQVNKDTEEVKNGLK